MTGQTIKVEGFVEIRNGDKVIKGKNKFVQTMLQNILNFLSANFLKNQGDYWYGPTTSFNMYVGTNTAQVTLYNTTVLTAPIGGAPGTAPNSIGGVTSNPSNGVFLINFTATWNAGTLPGNPTIGELALYLSVFAAGSLNPYQWTSGTGGGGTGTPVLVSRFAAADGVFTPFTINSANPLSIVWTIKYSFV